MRVMVIPTKGYTRVTALDTECCYFLVFLQKAAAALRQLEQQKAAAQKDLEPLVSQDSNGPVSSALPDQLNQAKNKQATLATLNDLYTKK